MLATLGCIASQGSGGTVIDRTTPVTVVNSAYDTSGNGGRKLVVLSNGWIVAVEKSNDTFYFQVDKIDNNGFVPLCNIYGASISTKGIAISSFGTNVFVLNATNANTVVHAFDAMTVTNINIFTVSPYYKGYSDLGQTDIAALSITIDSNGHLHAAWSSKNATYPNSFNIRYSKSTNGGVSWSTPTQVTTQNTSGTDATNPSIVCLPNGNPFIVFSYNLGGTYKIYKQTFNGTSWVGGDVYYGGSYFQLNPTATVSPNGVIHVAWSGADATDTINNIRYSKSTDYGATWSAAIKLTSGNTYANIMPSITCDFNNEAHVVWFGTSATYPTYGSIQSKKTTGGTFGSIIHLVGTVDSSVSYPSVCDNYKNFENPMLIFKNSSLAIKFYGKWTAA